MIVRLIATLVHTLALKIFSIVRNRSHYTALVQVIKAIIAVLVFDTGFVFFFPIYSLPIHFLIDSMEVITKNCLRGFLCGTN